MKYLRNELPRGAAKVPGLVPISDAGYPGTILDPNVTHLVLNGKELELPPLSVDMLGEEEIVRNKKGDVIGVQRRLPRMWEAVDTIAFYLKSGKALPSWEAKRLRRIIDQDLLAKIKAKVLTARMSHGVSAPMMGGDEFLMPGEIGVPAHLLFELVISLRGRMTEPPKSLLKRLHPGQVEFVREGFRDGNADAITLLVDAMDGCSRRFLRFPVVFATDVMDYTMRVVHGTEMNVIFVRSEDAKYLHHGDFDGDGGNVFKSEAESKVALDGVTYHTDLSELWCNIDIRETKIPAKAGEMAVLQGFYGKVLVGPFTYWEWLVARIAAVKLADIYGSERAAFRAAYEAMGPLMEKAFDGKKEQDDLLATLGQEVMAAFSGMKPLPLALMASVLEPTHLEFFRMFEARVVDSAGLLRIPEITQGEPFFHHLIALRGRVDNRHDRIAELIDVVGPEMFSVRAMDEIHHLGKETQAVITSREPSKAPAYPGIHENLTKPIQWRSNLRDREQTIAMLKAEFPGKIQVEGEAIYLAHNGARCLIPFPDVRPIAPGRDPLERPFVGHIVLTENRVNKLARVHITNPYAWQPGEDPRTVCHRLAQGWVIGNVWDDIFQAISDGIRDALKIIKPTETILSSRIRRPLKRMLNHLETVDEPHQILVFGGELELRYPKYRELQVSAEVSLAIAEQFWLAAISLGYDPTISSKGDPGRTAAWRGEKGYTQYCAYLNPLLSALPTNRAREIRSAFRQAHTFRNIRMPKVRSTVAIPRDAIGKFTTVTCCVANAPTLTPMVPMVGDVVNCDMVGVTPSGYDALSAIRVRSRILKEQDVESFKALHPEAKLEEFLAPVEGGFAQRTRAEWTETVDAKARKLVTPYGPKGMTKELKDEDGMPIQLYVEEQGQYVPIDILISAQAVIDKKAAGMVLQMVMSQLGDHEVEPTADPEELRRSVVTRLEAQGRPDGKLPVYRKTMEGMEYCGEALVGECIVMCTPHDDKIGERIRPIEVDYNTCHLAGIHVESKPDKVIDFAAALSYELGKIIGEEEETYAGEGDYDDSWIEEYA